MKKLLDTSLNVFFIILICLVAMAISTISLTKKINDFTNQYNQGISGMVIKKSVSILALSSGIINQINVRTGDEVSKGEKLVVMVNPSLTEQITTLKKFPDNVSAQTQVKLLEAQIHNLTITSPVDGVVGEIEISEGSGVAEFTKVMKIDADSNIQFLAQLTVDQYHAVQQSKQLFAYSRRLNQDFAIQPSKLNPDIKISPDLQPNKIGLYFNFLNPTEAKSLLNNENLELHITTEDKKINKPIDFFVNFWNGVLGKATH